MKKIASLLTLSLFSFLAGFSQLTIYSTTYDGGALPSGWTIDNFGSTGNYEMVYTDSSGIDDYVLCQTDAHSEDIDQYLTIAGEISTTEYESIIVGWDAKKSAGSGSWNALTTMTVQYSTDGATWTDIQSFTDVTEGGGWQTVTPVNADVAAEAENQANLRFRYKYVSNATNTAHYRINNFLVQGVCKTPVNDASGVSVTNLFSSSATLNWTLSTDASNSLVVMTSDVHASITATPASATTYTADAAYGSGQDIDATAEAEYVMYNGTGGSVDFTALSGGTTYYYEIYSFNDCSSTPEYKSTGITGNFTTTPRWNSISGADLSLAASWESDDDDNATTNVYAGTFNDVSTDFYVNDASSTMTTSTLNISGAGSRFVVEAGSDFSSDATNQLTANITLEGTGQITLNHATNPTLSSISTTSTVTYTGSATSVASTTFANLTISTDVTLSGDATVNSILTLNSLIAIDDANTLTLNGTVIGASSISGLTTSNLTIGGTGALGTLSFDPSNDDLATFTINRTGASNDVLLGTDVSVFTALVLTDGIFDLNGASITLDGATISNVSGTLKGNATSRFICNGVGAIGTMPIDQTSDATRTFQRIVNARTGGVTLLMGNNAIVNDQLLITDASGIIDLNGNTLELSDASFTGAGTVAGNSGILTLSGTTTSPGTILMDQTSAATRTLSTVTMNNSGATSKLTFGSNVIISTALTISDGAVSNGGFTIDGTGASLTISAGDTLELAGTTSFPTFGTETLDRMSVILYSGGTQSVTAKTYGCLAFSDDGGSATKTLAGTGGVLTAEMSIKINATFDMNTLAFTFNSDATGTAHLLEVTGTLANATSLTVQRYVGGTEGWRIFASPGAGALLSDWNGEMAMSGFPNSNDAASPFVSAYFYDESLNAGTAENGYQAPTDISDPLIYFDDKAGVFVYLDDNVGAVTPMPLIADLTISHTTGTKTLSNMSLTGGVGSETGWHAIGNPYPSELRWAEVIANGMSNIGNSGAVYTVDANQNFSASTTIVLASCEGGFVQVTAASNTITIQEDDKALTGQADTYNDRLAHSNEIPELAFQIQVGSHQDKAYIKFNANATDNFEHAYDARKMDNISGKTNISIMSSDNSESLEWNTISETSTSTIPIKVYRSYPFNITESYTLTINNIGQLLEHNKCLTFEDTVAGISFPLTGDTTYTFTMNDLTTAPRLFISISSPLTTSQINVSCQGDNDGSISVFGAGSSVTYVWTDQFGVTIPITGGDLNNLTAGYYHIEANGLSGTCSFSENTFEIIEPTPIVANSTPVDAVCNGSNTGSISLAPTGGNGSAYSYNWGNGNATNTLSNVNAGSYSVTITDSEGCKTEETMVISENDILSSSNLPTDATCFNAADGTIDLEAMSNSSSIFSYLWSNGDMTQDLSNLTAGQYDVTITDEYDCSTTSSILIQEPALIVATFDVSEDTVLLNNGGIVVFTNNSTGTTDFYWDFDDGSSSTDASPWHEYTSEGVYNVSLIAGSENCTETINMTIVVSSTTGIKTNGVTNEMKFVPVDGKLYGYSNGAFNNDVRVSIHNSIGQLVSSKFTYLNSNVVEIDLPSTSGVYIIKLEHEGNQYVKKHIIASN